MSWLDNILEGAESEVDEVISSAVDSADAQGIEDVNHATTNVLDGSESKDPNALTYDKTNTYSQDTEMGDEKTAGTVDVSLGDTKETVKAGNETDGVTESVKFTRDEMNKYYAEAVAEVVTESSDIINKKFSAKVAAAKDFKAKKLAQQKAQQEASIDSDADAQALLDSLF